MDKYLLVMDVSGDIDSQFAKEHVVKYIPMEYSLGEEMRLCEAMESDEVIKRFYDGQRGGDLTKTSQISPYMYDKYLSPYMEEGYSIVYLCLSGGLSSTFQSACMAKEALKEKFPELDFYPVDSLSATGGMGVLMERAVRNKEAGMSAEDNYKDLIEATHKIKHWFMVQDLNYLKRGGRVSATTAVVGTMLNIKPILKIDENGKLVTIDKKRGNKSAAAALIDLFKDNYDDNQQDVIYVIDADTKELADDVKEQLVNMYPDVTIRRASLSPIIGAHTGPGMVAICHMGK